MLDQTQHNLKVEDPRATEIKALSSIKTTYHNTNYVANTDTLLLHAIIDLISIFKGVICHIQLPAITHFPTTIVTKFKPWQPLQHHRILGFLTRATHHLTNNATHLSDVHTYHEPDQVSIGNGKKFPIHHIGSTFLSTKYKKFKLNRVLHVPKLTTNLISVSQLSPSLLTATAKLFSQRTVSQLKCISTLRKWQKALGGQLKRRQELVKLSVVYL